jgi:GGDEF domain-containing protein
VKLFDRVSPDDLDRRELQLTLFACLSIGILAIGSAVLMYPVVFAPSSSPADRTMRNAFFGFCVLSLLLAVYLLERQLTIQRLRRQMALDRQELAAAQIQSSRELLNAMPKFNSFQDRLPMEYRRAVATEQQLSIVVVIVKVPSQIALGEAGVSLLADAAKSVSRRLREQDSLYILGPACFGAVLPGVDAGGARGVASRIADGLADAAGASIRFSYKIDVLNYPASASGAHQLQEAVRSLIPADNSIRALAEEALT